MGLNIGAVATLHVVLMGCADAPSRGTYEVQDSAGVEIITSHGQAWDDGAAWQVSGEPTLQIGALDGAEETTFGEVRAAGWLSDGRIFVGDEQASAVRIFGANGDYFGTIGGPGQGPGELQWFLTVSRYRVDSLFVYDYAQRSVSIFGPDRSFARRFVNPVPEGNYWITGAFSDGSFLLYSPGQSRFSSGPGLTPDTTHIVRSRPDGSGADTVAAFVITIASVGPEGRAGALFLQPYGVVLARDDRIVWAEGERFEFIEADTDGTIRRIVRKAHRPVVVTDEMISEFQSHYLDLLQRNGGEGSPARIREVLSGAEYSQRLPALGPRIIVDALGHSWVARYHFPGAVIEEWEIFNPDGVWLGTVRTPFGFEVHEIAASQMIGVWKDALDVPYVRVLELDRQTRGAS